MASNEYRRRYTSIITPLLSALLSRSKHSSCDARATSPNGGYGDCVGVRRSSATKQIARFPARLFHSVLGQNLVDETALIELFQNPVIDQLFRLNFFNLWI